jgi:hypothetical protein
VVAAPFLVALFVVALVSPVAAVADDTLLILNAAGNDGLPRGYRSTSDASKHEGIRTVGLEKLRASASGQFSVNGFASIARRTGGAPLIVLDLRQESHGFVGGTAVSWFGPRNGANQGKTPEQISQDEGALLAGLAGQTTITVQKVTDKGADTRIGGTEAVSLPARNVQSEEQLVLGEGARYLRVPNADYVPFATEEVDQLVAFWQNRSPDTWVHAHCNAGGGRSTTALVLFDMLENANAVKFEDIVHRQDELGGNDLLSIRSEPKWRHDAQVQRAEFIRRLYRYAREHPHGDGETWSSWAARNP